MVDCRIADDQREGERMPKAVRSNGKLKLMPRPAAAGKPAAVMSLIHSVKLNGVAPYAYLRDVLERLSTQPASHIDELLPHRWQPGRSC